MDYLALKEFFVGDQHWHHLLGWHVALLLTFATGWSLARFAYKDKVHASHLRKNPKRPV